MAAARVERRLVKSHPELWEEVSDPETLARHLGELGEITITRVEPERTVAWEAELVAGTVEVEQAGWGTRVVLTASPAAAPAAEEPAPPPPDRAPEVPPDPVEQPPRSFFARLLPWGGPPPEPSIEPPRAIPPAPEPPPPAAEPDPRGGEQLTAVLNGVLDDLGAAHHRPFSRG